MYAPNAFLWIDYPSDLRWSAETAKRLYAEADVVHLHNGFSTAQTFERFTKPKPAVMHYHGTAFRQNPRAHLGQLERRGSLALVSTLDLWLIEPNRLEWLPSPYNLEWLNGLRR